ASDLRLERRWPAASFKNLLSQLIIDYPEYYFVLVGNKAEQAYVSEISGLFKDEARVTDTSGQLNLSELIELIRNSETVITNDTGPLHLSLALQKNTVGLFGPCSPAQYGQMQFCTPVYMNLYCSPCVHEFMIPPCGGNNRCMQDIQVERVLDAIRISSGAEKSALNETIIYMSGNRALGFVENRKK
ncbi:MAG: glycosyltransferase family 9 protein, partial [Bacteroidetes bacterium]|nr:glycosyltransferase family 9 protein [Bacteroidota bacterium]